MALLVAWQSDWSEVDGTLIAERSEHKGITGFPRHGGKRHPCRDDGGREIARCLVCSQSEALTTLIHQRRLTPSCSSSGECGIEHRTTRCGAGDAHRRWQRDRDTRAGCASSEGWCVQQKSNLLGQESGAP